MQSSPFPLRPNYLVFSSTPYSQTPQPLFHIHIKTSKIVVLYVLVFVFLGTELEDWRPGTEEQANSPRVQSALTFIVNAVLIG